VVGQLLRRAFADVRWFEAGLALLAIALGVPKFVDACEFIYRMNWADAGWGDGRVDWAAARLFLEGKSPFTPEGLQEIGLQAYGFGHPPTTPFWFLPLARLEQGLMAQTIALLVILAVFVIVRMCVTELNFPAANAMTFLVFSYVIGSSWMIEHLHVVQISAFIAFAYAAGWYYLRRGADLAGGAALGFACTLKLFPGVVVLLLLVTRRWRAFIAACSAWAVVAVVMTSRYGVDSWFLFLEQQGKISETWMGNIRNGSLHGIVLRALTPICEAHALPSKAATAIVVCIAALLIVPAAFVAFRLPRHGRGFDIAFALFTVLSAFLNPWAWEHYCVILVLPISVAVVSLPEVWLALRAEWSAARASTRRFVAASGLTLLGACGITIVIWALLGMDMWVKERVVHQYFRVKNTPLAGWVHREMHLLEIENWWPWVGTILVLGGLLVAKLRVTAQARIRAKDEPPALEPLSEAV
jgi:hypothetical protein